MSLRRITSQDNSLYREWLALAARPAQRRSALQTLLDGAHLIEEAVHHGIPPAHLIFADAFPERDAWRARLPTVPAVELPAALFRRLSGSTTPSGILAVIGIPTRAPSDEPAFGMMLENVQDPGNMGAVLRSAAAAGVDVAYLSKGCAEAWSPKALRGGQGAQFRLAIHEAADLSGLAQQWTGRIYAAVPKATRSLYDLDLTGRACMVFGNEGAGLSESICEKAMPFSIPMPGGFESLNVAAAAAICLFERVRQGQATEERR